MPLTFTYDRDALGTLKTYADFSLRCHLSKVTPHAVRQLLLAHATTKNHNADQATVPMTDLHVAKIASDFRDRRRDVAINHNLLPYVAA